jgi:putative ABC transport system permease protein
MNLNSFTFKMVRREMLTSWRHFGFFLFCISLGVGSITGVGGLSDQIENSVMKEAKGLLGGDIEVELNHPMSSKGLKLINSLEERRIKNTLVYEMIAMAGNFNNVSTQLVELKGVKSGYPFYGILILDPPGGTDPFLKPDLAWVEESFLIRLGLKTGERFKLGEAELTIAGVIKKEPDRITESFSLGPRVIISEETLNQTKLIQPGSRVRYRYLLKLPSSLSNREVVSELKTALSDERATIESFSEAQPRLRRFLNNLTIYLGFIGLISLFIGGIGVGNSVHAYLKEKMLTMGVLKCLGAPSRTLFTIYFLQTYIMGVVGSAAGAGLGLGLHFLFQDMLKTIVPHNTLAYFFPVTAILKGIIAGMLVVLLFSLFPLLRIKYIKPNMILRRETQSRSTGFKNASDWIIVGAVVLGILLFVFWQAGSWRVWGMFIGVFISAVILLKLSALVMLKGVRRLKPASFSVRHGMANLNRPGQFIQSVIFSIGFGMTVISAILVIRGGLVRQLTDNIPNHAPTFFFIDIQKNQKEPFERLLAEKYQQWRFQDHHEMVPIVRSHLDQVGKTRVKDLKNSDAWYYQREYVLTSQKDPPYENKIIQGTWWDLETESARNQISIEEDVAKHLGAGIGSVLAFDIQGTLVQGTVTSIRSVNWENLRTNFFIIFSPGSFKEIPISYIATSESKADQDPLFNMRSSPRFRM